jgi:hypothetical protein
MLAIWYAELDSGDVGIDPPDLVAADQSGISDSALVDALGGGASCAGRGRGIGNAAALR